MSIREAAIALGTSELTVRRRIKDGRLVNKLEGGKYFVKIGAPPPPVDPAERDGSSAKPTAPPKGTEDAPPHVEAPSGTTDLLPQLGPLLAEHRRLAESAGRAALLEEQLRSLETKYSTLQEGAMALANRNGWLESKLEEREREMKLLEDSQAKRSWWRRLFGSREP